MRLRADRRGRVEPPCRVVMISIGAEEANDTLEELAIAATRLEQTAIRRYARPQDRATRLAARVLARACISEWLRVAADSVAIVPDMRGRPTVDGAADEVVVSLSHTEGRALVALQTGGRVGVDVEIARAADFFDPMAGSIFSDDELATYHGLPSNRRSPWATACWTRKEAVLKAVGTGLAVDPRDVTVGMEIGPRLDGNAAKLHCVDDLQLLTWRLGDSVASLCTDRARAASIDVISRHELLAMVSSRK